MEGGQGGTKGPGGEKSEGKAGFEAVEGRGSSDGSRWLQDSEGLR